MKLWPKHLGLGSLILFMLLAGRSIAQEQLIPLQNQYQTAFESALNRSGNTQHLGFLPLLQSEVHGADSLISALHFDRDLNRSWTARKLFLEHLIQYDSGDVQFSIDPLINFELSENHGDNPRDVNLFKNMRGFVLRLNLGKRVSVYSAFRENQANLPNYLHRRTRRSRVAYGQGRVKQFNKDGFDFAMAEAVISYRPSENLNLQLGHGKHFIGYGHRSLLLSDLAFNYPFIKASTTWLDGKLQYQNLYGLFQNIQAVETDFESEGLLERKQGAFHYLDFAAHPKFNIALFEGMMYTSLDTGGNVSVPGSYYVPIIFVNSLIEGDSKKGNTKLGVNWTYKAIPSLRIYGQGSTFALDNESLSYQLGAHYYFREFPIRLNVEYNSMAELTGESQFNHYNESLNSPADFGSNELLCSIVFHQKRWLTQIGANQIEMDRESIQFAEISQSYILNPKTNLALRLGVQYRMNTRTEEALNLIQIGLSTQLQNLYFNY